MTKANEIVRASAKAHGIHLWEIANYLGISEPTIVRWLRIPLSPEREKAVMEAIEALAKEES